jgi:hypothetical protein
LIGEQTDIEVLVRKVSILVRWNKRTECRDVNGVVWCGVAWRGFRNGNAIGKFFYNVNTNGYMGDQLMLQLVEFGHKTKGSYNSAHHILHS